jgi:hypothetical protein
MLLEKLSECGDANPVKMALSIAKVIKDVGRSLYTRYMLTLYQGGQRRQGRAYIMS